MIMSRFRSMGLAAGAAASVLSCYMVSLRVARERGEVERIQQQIADARQGIRDLKTELGTRGRMLQLERWNSDVLALSAPGAAQYIHGAVELANYQPTPAAAPPAADAQPKLAEAVEVKPATPAAPPKLVTASFKPASSKPAASTTAMLHNASYVTIHDDGPTRVALLDENELGPIGRAATHEAKTGRKAVP